MTDHRTATRAAVAAVVLGALGALAGANTAYVVSHAVREPTGGVIAAAAVCAVVTGALALGCVRMWRR